MVLALVLLASCGSDGEVVTRSPPTPAGAGTGSDLPVQADGGTEVSIEGIDQHVGQADVIAIGTFTDIQDSVLRTEPDVDDPNGGTTEFGALTRQADDVIKGDGAVEAGAVLAVRIGDRIFNGEGEPISALAPYVAGLEDDGWESVVGGRYLVFLTRVASDGAAPWAISSSQGVLAVDDGVVSRLTQDAGPGVPDYTEVLDGVTVEEARVVLTS